MPFGSLRLSDLAKILMKFSYSLSSSSSDFTRKKSSASCFSAGFSMNKPEYLIEKKRLLRGGYSRRKHVPHA